MDSKEMKILEDNNIEVFREKTSSLEVSRCSCSLRHMRNVRLGLYSSLAIL